MRSLPAPRFVNILFLLILALGFGGLTVSAQKLSPQEFALLKSQAADLHQQQKFTESLPLIEKLVATNPEDADVQFMYGFALLGQAANTKDPLTLKEIRIKARNAFIKSKDLGRTEPVLSALIASLPEDGSSSGTFSNHLEAERIMRDAEAYFSQGKMDEALANYQKALKLDPTLYEAALYSGDVYMQKEKFDDAEIWYQKAIAINPARETAYRYSATPLMKQRK